MASWTFTLEGAHDLTVEEIWPDGDAPENPTLADVIAVVQKHGNGGPLRLARDWNLAFTLCVDGEEALG